jgi:hypothetical protein
VTGVYDKIVKREADPSQSDPLVPEPSGGVSLIRRFPKGKGVNALIKRSGHLARAKPQVRRGRR